MTDKNLKNDFSRLPLALIRLIGVIVPRRLRADWQQEWEAELRYREMMLAEWERLDWRNKLDLFRRSLGAFTDALLLQPQRLEDEMFQDLRFGARLLLRNPIMTLAAVLSLALGIGANTAIFSLVNAVMLRPLPYHQPERLMQVYQAAPNTTKGSLPTVWSYPRFEFLRDNSSSFSQIAGYRQTPYNLTGTNEAERLQVEMVSASYFPLLGVEAIAGRTFTADEDKIPGENLAAMIGYGLWQRRFGGNAGILGQTIELDKKPFTVVGVLPQGFRGQDGTADVWVTMMAAPVLRYKRILANPNNSWLQVIGRLKDGVTQEKAQSEMQLVSAQIEKAYPGPTQARVSGTTNEIVTLIPLLSAKVDPAIAGSFLILLAAVGLVLLIACGNVANLLLARAVMRRKEFAMRVALGAGRLRLIRQLLTESLLLALIGGAMGVLVARLGILFLNNFRPSDDAQFWSSYTRTFDFFTVDLDWRVLAFNFLLALLTGVLFGLLPAIQSTKADVNEALKDVAGGIGAGSRRWLRINARSLLVVTEIALSLVLLTGAGLMIRSLSRLQGENLGFSADNVLTMAAPSRDAKPDFYERLLARVRTLPGVESAAIGSSAPLLGYSSKTVMDIADRTDVAQVAVGLHSVSPGYLQTLQIPLLKGRDFTAQDRIGAPRVALINQTAADELFSGQDPIGKRVKPYVGPEYDTKEEFVEIIGVVADAKYGRIEEAVAPDLYLCALQPTDPTEKLIVKTNVAPATIASAIRNEVLALDRNVPLIQIKTMSDRAAEVTSRTRFITMLLGLFAGLALLLSAMGIYGVMAYGVSARTREVGIRMALGAQKSDVFKLVIRDGLKLILAGLAIGLPAAWAAMRVLNSQLYEISATDPQTLVFVVALLVGVALLACYFPARRATRTDPMNALRYE